jgi:hypothetical protein
VVQKEMGPTGTGLMTPGIYFPEEEAHCCYNHRNTKWEGAQTERQTDRHDKMFHFIHTPYSSIVMG